MDLSRLGWRRALSMPGLCVSVAEQIAALKRVAGEQVAARIRREPDETINRIVAGWPSDFNTARALSLGFKPDQSYEAILRVHIEDELGGTIR